MWSSVALPSIVAAVISGLVNWATGGLSVLFHRLTSRRRPDHRTITNGHFTTDQGSRAGYLCVIRFGPARAVGKTRSIDPDGATALVRALDADLSTTARHFSPDSVLFETDQTVADSTHRSPLATVYLSADGLVEFARFLTVQPVPTTLDRALAVDEVADLIGRARQVVASGLYRRVFGIRRRMDWSLSVSAFIREDPTGQSLPWTQLLVDGQVLGGRASDPHPAIPVLPFGPPDSYNVRQRAGQRRVATPMIVHWARRSHYWNPGADLGAVVSHPNQGS